MSLLDVDGRKVYGANFVYFKAGYGYAAGGAVGIAWDDRGNAAILETIYGGAGLGEFGKALGAFEYDNLSSIDQLTWPPSGNLSFGIGDGFWGVNADFSISFEIPPHIPTFAFSAGRSMSEGAVIFGGISYSRLSFQSQITELVKKYGAKLSLKIKDGKLIVLAEDGKEITSFDFNPIGAMKEIIGNNGNRKKDREDQAKETNSGDASHSGVTNLIDQIYDQYFGGH